MILYLSTIPPLLLIVYQDFKHRYISAWVLVLLLGLAITLGIQSIGLVDTLKNALFNCAFLSLQLIIVSIYFSIKSKKWVNITSEQIGWGDILFFLPLACFLGPVWFLFFYMISLVLILCFYLILKITFTQNEETIPLAGGQALCLIVLVLLKWSIGFDLYENLLF